MNVQTLAVAAVAAFSCAPVRAAESITVTDEVLSAKPLPQMAALETEAGPGHDWITVGRTVMPVNNKGVVFSEELAHLNADGNLVLIDDGGHQYHAVWLNDPLPASACWEVSFRYAPRVDFRENQYKDGVAGWTFVMQPAGPEAYSDYDSAGLSSAALGMPRGSCMRKSGVTIVGKGPHACSSIHSVQVNRTSKKAFSQTGEGAERSEADEGEREII